MTMVMLVAEIQAGEPVLGPDAAERLGSLGITRIALLRDLSSTAVVLEGWAFDAARIDAATRAVFPAGAAGLRTFHDVEHVDVSPPRGARSSQDGRLKEKAMERMARRFRFFAVTGLIALSLSAFAGTAAAATDPAPGTGLVGACNMLLAWGVGANGGMANAMSVDNADGNDGMWQAVAVSGCPLRP